MQQFLENILLVLQLLHWQVSLGDIVYNANPNEGGYVGWVYTVENGWRRFGNVSLI